MSNTRHLVRQSGLPGLWSRAVMLGTNHDARAADDCLAGPNRPPGPGGHWYYHLDRATDRKCWYLVEPTARTPDRRGAATAAAAPEQAPQPTFGSFFSSLGLHRIDHRRTPDTGDARASCRPSVRTIPERRDAAGQQSQPRAPAGRGSLARPQATSAGARPAARRAARRRRPLRPTRRSATRCSRNSLKWRQRQ